MTSPQSGQNIGGTYKFRAQTTDNSAVTSLSFYRDDGIYLDSGVPNGSDFYRDIAIGNLTEGAHSFYATATTTSGSYSSEPITASVVVDTSPPSISLTAPISGSTVGNGLLIEPMADGTGSGINRIIYSRTSNGTNITLGTTETQPFSFRSTVAANGTHIFKGRAWDNAGNRADSPDISVTVSGSNAWVKEFQTIDIRGLAITPGGQIVLSGQFKGTTTSLGGSALSSVGGSDAFLAMFSRDGTHLWSTSVGSIGNDEGQKVTTDTQGNILWTGTLNSSISWAGGTHRGYFIAKYSASGTPLWVRSDSPAISHPGITVAVDDTGNVLAAGSFSGLISFGGAPRASLGGNDIWVAKFDPSGTLIWLNQFGGADNDLATGIGTDSAGNVIVTGYFRGTVSFGNQAYVAQGADIFVLKLSSQGTLDWSAQLGGQTDDKGGEVAVEPQGNFALSGLTNANLSGVGGETFPTGTGLLAKYTSEGVPIFSIPFGRSITDVKVTIAPGGRIGFSAYVLSTTGNCWLKGVTPGGIACVGELSGEGDLLWYESYGNGAKYVTPWGVAAWRDDGTILVGGGMGGNLVNGNADFGGFPIPVGSVYDSYLYTLPANPALLVAPKIAASSPPNGFIDPLEDRDATSGALFGVKDVSITFSAPVIAAGGASLGPLNFPLSFTRNSAPATDLQTGQVPTVSSVTANSTASYTLHLSSRIPVGAWTKITAQGVVDLSGTAVSPAGNSIVLGFLPMDVTQDGKVLGEDINRWLAIKNGSYSLPAPLTPVNFCDQTRDGSVLGNDITRAVQLLNGTPGTTFRAWSGFDMGARP